MNTHDKIELPPLPPLHIVPSVEPVDYPEVAQVLLDYARAAIEADRKRIAKLRASGSCAVCGSRETELHTKCLECHAETVNYEQAKHNKTSHADRKRRGEPVGWQPIETAPKDGTTILVWFKQHGAMTVCWGDRDYDHTSEYAIWLVDDHKHGPYPVRGYSRGDDTHWMPLPPAPQPAEPVKCLNPSMGEHACSNRAQCWEPCGELGSSIEHAKVAEPVKVPVIEPNDLRIDTYRAEPHSAWIVKADTGVRVTHVPTGLSAACHEDRSVHRNRALAMEKLQKMLQTHGPVKVPSDAQLKEFWRQLTEAGGDEVDFARALLDRYGQQAQSTDLPVTPEEEEAWQELERRS